MVGMNVYFIVCSSTAWCYKGHNACMYFRVGCDVRTIYVHVYLVSECIHAYSRTYVGIQCMHVQSMQWTRYIEVQTYRPICLVLTSDETCLPG